MSYFDTSPNPSAFSKVGTAVQSFWILVASVVIGIPIYIVCWTISAFENATTANVVWVVEMNPDLFEGLQNDEQVRNYYAKLGSLAEAEQWLLSNNYQKISLPTTQIGGNFDTLFKTFPIKNRSVIDITVDHGDGDLHRIFFRYPNGKSGMNFDNFDEAKPVHVSFKLPWRSSDISGRHNISD